MNGFRTCLLFVGIALSASAGSIRAADAEGGHGEKVGKLKAVVNDHGKKETKVFDLNDEAHRKQLAEHIRQQQLENLVEDKAKASLTDIRWDLGLWTIVVFVLLYAILHKFAWGPLLAGLQKREFTIADALAQAKKANEDAQALQAELRKRLDNNAQEIRGLMEEARKDGQKLKDELVATGNTEVNANRDRLRREMDTARDQALQELWTQTAQLATLVSAKTIRRDLGTDDHRRLVDEALAELKQTANGSTAGVHA